jgi:hypothetical protein
MDKQILHEHKVHTDQYTVLTLVPPFVDLILHSMSISTAEFQRIAQLAESYPNDPRMVEMVRAGGDASAKVPYLLAEDETPRSVLETLRSVAEPYIEHLKRLPGPMQTTIHLLLSLNTIPRGFEQYAVPALLEIDHMQARMVKALQVLMAGRALAEEFHQANHTALVRLDEDWPHLRTRGPAPWPRVHALPDKSAMEFEPVFYKKRLVRLHETCVIVDPPLASELQHLIPPVLRRPLPEAVEPPETGSADWLIREVGKVGRHFTRALLDIITIRLDREQLELDAANYDLINLRAQEALREFVERLP